MNLNNAVLTIDGREVAVGDVRIEYDTSECYSVEVRGRIYPTESTKKKKPEFEEQTVWHELRHNWLRDHYIDEELGIKEGDTIESYMHRMLGSYDKAEEGADKTYITSTPFMQRDWIKQVYFDSAKYAHVFELDEDNADAMSYFNHFLNSKWDYEEDNKKEEEEMCKDRCDGDCAVASSEDVSVARRLKDAELNNREKVFRNYGYVDEDGGLTRKGEKLLLHVLFLDNQDKFAAAVTKITNVNADVEPKED